MRLTEAKTKASSVATFVVALIGLSYLGDTSTDFAHWLPDALEAPAYALLPAVAAWLAGYVRKHKPGSLSDSAVEALRERVRGKH